MANDVKEEKRTVFRNEYNPDKEIDPVDYSLSYLKENPDTEVYVGCDSQNKGRHTVYATTICFRVGTRGVHVIYNKERVSRINNIRDRLWEECIKAVETARMLTDNGVRVYQVELDYNSEEGWESNKLISQGRGYIVGLGFKAGVKPEELVAARAADHIAVKG